MEEGEEGVSVFISLDSVRNEISRGGTRALQRRRTLRLHPRWTCIAQRDVIHRSLMARDTPVVFIFPLNITLSCGVSEEKASPFFGSSVCCLSGTAERRLSACLNYTEYYKLHFTLLSVLQAVAWGWGGGELRAGRRGWGVGGGGKQHGKYAIDEMKRKYSLTDLEVVKLENCVNGFSRNEGWDLFL